MHVLADALTSVMAIVALLVAKYFGWTGLDPIMGIVGAVVIIKWSLGLVGQTAPILLDKSAPQDYEKQVIQSLESVGAKVTDIHIWKVSAHHYSASICLDTATSHNSAYFRQQLAHFGKLDHVTLEVNNG
jgi:cation diffusion facilitator family transporter